MDGVRSPSLAYKEQRSHQDALSSHSHRRDPLRAPTENASYAPRPSPLYHQRQQTLPPPPPSHHDRLPKGAPQPVAPVAPMRQADAHDAVRATIAQLLDDF